MIYQVLAWILVAVAALYTLWHIWREIDGLIHPERAGMCPGCGMCNDMNDKPGGPRRPPELKVTPLIRLETRGADTENVPKS